MSPENRKITSSPREPEHIIEDDQPRLPELKNYIIYEGSARKQVSVWSNYGAHPLEPVQVEDDWVRVGSGRNAQEQKVFVLERTVLGDEGVTTIRRQVLWSQYKLDPNYGKLYYFETLRTVDTAEIPVQEILARIEASYREQEQARARRAAAYGVGTLAVTDASYPSEGETPSAAAVEDDQESNYAEQLYFELAGNQLSEYQHTLFAVQEVARDFDIPPVGAHWVTVTDESIVDAHEVLRTARLADSTLNEICKRFRAEYEVRELDLVDCIREDDRLRYRIAEHLLEKFEIQSKTLKDLPYSEGTKRPEYPSYDAAIPNHEYTVLLALAKLDGTFRHDHERPIREGKEEAVEEGKFRVAAEKLLFSRLENQPTA